MNISKEVKLANTNRQAAPSVASSRKIAIVAGVLYLLTLSRSRPLLSTVR